MDDYIEEEPKCDFYGCQNERLNGVTLVVTLGETDSATLFPCDMHYSWINMGVDAYSIGRAYNNEVEIRQVPAQPTEPTVVEPTE